MAETISIMIVGVGGQGTLLASRILGTMAQMMDMDVKVSEVHGMSQRGGSVVTYVRMGDQVASPLIESGGADAMIAFEELEALRFIHMVREGGDVIVNTQQIMPMSVVTGQCAYPQDILDRLNASQAHIHPVDALTLAEKAGSVRAVNTVIMGCLAKKLGMPKAKWLEALRSCVPPKTVEVNEQAFLLGYEQ